jgi:hypothetical protein
MALILFALILMYVSARPTVDDGNNLNFLTRYRSQQRTAG